MKPPKRLFRDRAREAPATDDLSRFVVLVPYQRHIEPECERQLRHAESAGIEVFRLGGCSEIGFNRSQMLSVAMSQGKEAALFVDSDIAFNVEDAVRILGRPEPVVCGLYSQKRFGRLNAEFVDRESPVVMGVGGGDRPVLHAGAGFLRITRSACEAIVAHHGLPPCDGGDGPPIYPFFIQMIVQDGDRFLYLGEDYSFCRRAWEAGLPVVADTTIRLYHLGVFPYGPEEAAGMKIDRLDSVTIRP